MLLRFILLGDYVEITDRNHNPFILEQYSNIYYGNLENNAELSSDFAEGRARGEKLARGR